MPILKSLSECSNNFSLNFKTKYIIIPAISPQIHHHDMEFEICIWQTSIAWTPFMEYYVWRKTSSSTSRINLCVIFIINWETNIFGIGTDWDNNKLS